MIFSPFQIQSDDKHIKVTVYIPNRWKTLLFLSNYKLILFNSFGQLTCIRDQFSWAPLSLPGVSASLQVRQNGKNVCGSASLAPCIMTEFMDILNTVDWACLSKGQTRTLFCLCCNKESLAWEQERQLSTVWVLRHERQKVICQRPADTYEDLS